MDVINHKEKSKKAAALFGCLLERHKLTQEQVAGVVGVSAQAVGAMVNGRFSPTLDVLFKYLNAVNNLAGTNYSLSDIDPDRYSHTFFMVTADATPMLVPSLDKIPSDSAFTNLLNSQLNGALPKGIYPASNGGWVLVVGGEIKILQETKQQLSKR